MKLLSESSHVLDWAESLEILEIHPPKEIIAQYFLNLPLPRLKRLVVTGPRGIKGGACGIVSLDVFPERLVDNLSKLHIKGFCGIYPSFMRRLARSNLKVLDVDCASFLPDDVSLDNPHELFPNLYHLECTFKKWRKKHWLIDVLKSCAEGGGLKQLRRVIAKTFWAEPYFDDPEALPDAIAFLKLVQESVTSAHLKTSCKEEIYVPRIADNLASDMQVSIDLFAWLGESQCVCVSDTPGCQPSDVSSLKITHSNGIEKLDELCRLPSLQNLTLEKCSIKFEELSTLLTSSDALKRIELKKCNIQTGTESGGVLRNVSETEKCPSDVLKSVREKVNAFNERS